MIKVLATDLDGTLFYPRRPKSLVEKKNRRLIDDFTARGGRVVLVSSRGEEFMERTRKALGDKVDFIGANGAVTSINGQIIQEKALDPEAFKALLSDIRRDYDPGFILLSTKAHGSVMTKTRVSKWNSFLWYAFEAIQGAYREPFVRSDEFFYDQIAKGEVHKAMFVVGLTKKKQMLAEKITRSLGEKYPNFEFCWLNQFIEITPKGCTKDAAIAFYLDYLGISHDNVLVIGDSGNDTRMFEAFHEHSYCMAHAKESVRAKAHHVVRRVSDLYPLLCPSEDSNPSAKGTSKK